jgi:hypothetical protein
VKAFLRRRKNNFKTKCRNQFVKHYLGAPDQAAVLGNPEALALNIRTELRKQHVPEHSQRDNAITDLVTGFVADKGARGRTWRRYEVDAGTQQQLQEDHRAARALPRGQRVAEREAARVRRDIAWRRVREEEEEESGENG